MPKGRPALAGTRKFSKLEIRLTDAERASLDAAAAGSGKPTSTWARDTLLQIAAEHAAKANPVSVKKRAGKAVRKPAG